MNFFRSEETVRAWVDYDPETGNSVKPVREWAAALAGARICQTRLEADFVAKSEEYANELIGRITALLS